MFSSYENRDSTVDYVTEPKLWPVKPMHYILVETWSDRNKLKILYLRKATDISFNFHFPS